MRSVATSCRGSSTARGCRCLIGIAVVALSIVVGITLGLIAGFARGITEIAIMRFMDIILTLPSLLLAIVIVAILGPGIMNAMLAVAVVVLPHYVRITRAAVITETSKDYVTAARANGAGLLRLMFIEVLPNCAAPLIVQASLGVSVAILDAAALGFLGLGAQPPASEWGTMLADAREFVLRAWWVVTFPGDHDPGHRARVQPARATACATRSTRSSSDDPLAVDVQSARERSMNALAKSALSCCQRSDCPSLAHAQPAAEKPKFNVGDKWVFNQSTADGKTTDWSREIVEIPSGEQVRVRMGNGKRRRITTAR